MLYSKLQFCVLLTCFVLVRANFVDTSVAKKEEECQPWFYYNTATGNCECINLDMISCVEEDVYLVFGYCAAHDQELQSTFIAACPYFQSRDFNSSVTQLGYLLLPNNYSDLNSFMCDPMNRKGFVCSDCVDHYGPSVTSYGYECSKCASSWQGILMYLLVEFLPITLLYLVILIFQIDLVTPPVPCFIMYSQLVYSGFHYYAMEAPSAHQVMFTDSFTLRPITKILLTFCGIMNLDFFQYFLPTFCVSNRLKTIHIVALSYLKAFYPLILILLTWICIKLYDRNFRLLVYIWKPFHRCLLQLQKGWNSKNNIVNVFCSFILLSYGKYLYLTNLMVNCRCISVFSEFGAENRICRAYLDPNIDCWRAKHLLYTVPALLVLLLFNILPTFLLILYPFKGFKDLLFQCKLDTVALFNFTDKFYCYYRDGSRVKPDMRCCSGLYFFLMAVACSVYIVTRHLIGMSDQLFSKGILFWTSSLIIIAIKPYNKKHMNILDSLLLAHLGILCNIMSLPSDRYFGSHYVLVVQVLCLLPFAVLILYLAKRISVASYCAFKSVYQHVKRWAKSRPLSVERQLLTHPSSTNVNYGTH